MPQAKVCEWPTLALILAATFFWGIGILSLVEVTALGGFALAAVMGTLHSSLQHEVLHGHPTRNTFLNEALIYFPLNLFVPYRRFKKLHLQHHNNDLLTDPYDDPESFYMMWRDWGRLPAVLKLVLNANNTLIGRLSIGPLVSMTGFLGAEAKLLLRGEAGVREAWGHHLLGLIPVLVFVTQICELPLWMYIVCVVYPSMSLLMLRTYAEHRAHETPAGRTIIVEFCPVFSLLFLNNNLHLVHHLHPRTAWYQLPAMYRARKAHWAELNDGYVFSSYFDLARRYLFKRKEQIPHPLISDPLRGLSAAQASSGVAVSMKVPPITAADAMVPASKS
ncbi:fatty acid desaturase [Roseibium sp.]|uniref:fatty acid desaturase n=1 Tax=Roseibium sp. TaxID=1936156 RepID=UPI003A986F1D